MRNSRDALAKGRFRKLKLMYFLCLNLKLFLNINLNANKNLNMKWRMISKRKKIIKLIGKEVDAYT
jgi:hypothetical protein